MYWKKRFVTCRFCFRYAEQVSVSIRKLIPRSPGGFTFAARGSNPSILPILRDRRPPRHRPTFLIPRVPVHSFEGLPSRVWSVRDELRAFAHRFPLFPVP